MHRMMLFIFLLGCTPFLSFGQHIIEGKLTWNPKWNDKIYLIPFDHFQRFSEPIDSAKVEHNTFYFSLKDLPKDQILYRLILCHKGFNYKGYIENGINDNYIFITLNPDNNDTLRITGSVDSLFYSYRIEGDRENEKLSMLRDLRMPMHYATYHILTKLRSNKLDKKGAVAWLKAEYDSVKQKLRRLQFDKKDTAFNLLALYEFYRCNGLKYDSVFFSRILSKVDNRNLALVRYIDSDLIYRIQFIKAHRTFPQLHLEDTNRIKRMIRQYPADLFVIDFWASWCSPCREAIRHELNREVEKWEKKGVRLIGVNMDKKESNWMKAVRSDKPRWIQLRYIPGNRKNTFIKFYVDGLPTYLVLDKDLRIIYKARNTYDVIDYVSHYLMTDETN